MCRPDLRRGAAARACRSRWRRQAAKQSMAERVRAMVEFLELGVPTVDYGNNLRASSPRMGASRAPSPSPASCRPTFARSFAGPWALSLGGPVRACRGHLHHRRQGEGADAGRRPSAQLARHGAASASPSRDMPARIRWVGPWATATGPRASPFSDGGRDGRAEGARSSSAATISTRALVASAQPRDRGDAAMAPTPSPTGRR